MNVILLYDLRGGGGSDVGVHFLGSSHPPPILVDQKDKIVLLLRESEVNHFLWARYMFFCHGFNSFLHCP